MEFFLLSFIIIFLVLYQFKKMVIYFEHIYSLQIKLGYPVLKRLSKCHKHRKQCLFKFYWVCEYFLFDFMMLQTVVFKS